MPYKTVQLGNTLQQQYEADPRLLMAMQQMQQGGSSAPVQSPLEGIARALQGPLGAYMAKTLQNEYQSKQSDQYGKIADILAPPDTTVTNGPIQSAPLPQQSPGITDSWGQDANGRIMRDTSGGTLDYSTPQISSTPSPNHDAIVAAMSSGVIKPDSFGKAIADKLGFGEPKAPTKVGPGDVLLGPDNKTPIYSAPFKPDKPPEDPDIVRTARVLFPNDPAKQNDYIVKNSASNVKSIVNVNPSADNAGWQMATDPSNGNTPYRINVRNGETRGLDGQPYAPKGYGKVGTFQGRSPAAMYLQKYQSEHPNATSDDIAGAAATFGAQQKAVKDFATGPEGNIITRVNTAVSHLDTLQKVGEAMDNGDVQAFNKLRNIWRTQFGSELPTNFNAAMPIVAGEVSKAVVGTQGGTREDRAELEASLQDAASKRQLAGATGTQKALLQGQLQSRRRQYETSTGRKDFDKFLSGDTQRELGIAASSSQPAPNAATSGPVKVSGDADYAKLPSGTVFIGPDGKQRKKP